MTLDQNSATTNHNGMGPRLLFCPPARAESERQAEGGEAVAAHQSLALFYPVGTSDHVIPPLGPRHRPEPQVGELRLPLNSQIWRVEPRQDPRGDQRPEV